MVAPADTLDVVTYISETARECWEPIWIGWKRYNGHPAGDLPSSGVCVPTSLALCEMLRRCVNSVDTGWYWAVTGGRPTKKTPRGGYWQNGTGGPHAWVEGRRRGARITVDITADQFGAPDVVVVDGVPSTYTSNATRQLMRDYERHEAVTTELWAAALAFALKLQAEQV